MVRLFSKPVAGGLVALCLVAGAAVPLAHAMPAHPVVVTAPSAPAIRDGGLALSLSLA